MINNRNKSNSSFNIYENIKSNQVPNLPLNQKNLKTKYNLIQKNNPDHTKLTSQPNSKSHPDLLINNPNNQYNNESVLQSPGHNTSTSMMVHRQYKLQDM